MGLLAVVLVLDRIWSWRQGSGVWGKPLVVILADVAAGLAALVVPYVVFNLVVSGQPFPNTFYAKQAGDIASTSASAEYVWQVICEVGNDGDYFYARWLWWLRRALDWLVGGPSFRRKRRHPQELRVGDVVELQEEMLSVVLGPGLLGRIYDGLQNPADGNMMGHFAEDTAEKYEIGRASCRERV
mgnify:CR=1 FL=1